LWFSIPVKEWESEAQALEGMEMKPIKWGILSTANIGVEKVIPGMLKSKNIVLIFTEN